MRSIRRGVVLAALAIAFVAAIPASADAQWFIAGSAGMSGFSGDDFDGIDAGFQAQGAIGSRVGGGKFSLAGLFGYSNHGVSESESSIDAITVEAQAAVRVGPEEGTAAFIGARGGYASIGDDEKVNGLIIGPVAGVGFPLGGRTTLGVAGDWQFLSLSDDVGGSKWGVGVYLLVGLGGGS